MTLTRRALSTAALVLCLTGAPLASALAEPLTVQMAGGNRQLLSGQRYALATYHLNFVTSQQATSVMSIGSRARLAMVLEGVDAETMRRLTNEAYEDLRSQMQAAGLTLVSPEEARAMTVAAGVREIPGNVEVAGIGPGITVGASVRRGWVTMGPDAAPALQPLAAMRGQMSQIAAISALGGFNRTPDSADLVVLAPSLVIDFARMQAARPGMFSGAASTSGQVGFGILAESKVTVQKPAGRNGIGTPGGFQPRGDVWSNTDFADVVQGGAAVRAGPSFSTVIDENYQAVQRARGDAVVVNLPVWEGLVRDAYRGYNAGIVAAIQSVRR